MTKSKQPLPQPPPLEWTVAEVDGAWWAYLGARPASEQFVSHGTRPRGLIGPFYCKEYAEERVYKLKAPTASPPKK